MKVRLLTASYSSLRFLTQRIIDELSEKNHEIFNNHEAIKSSNIQMTIHSGPRILSKNLSQNTVLWHFYVNFNKYTPVFHRGRALIHWLFSRRTRLVRNLKSFDWSPLAWQCKCSSVGRNSAKWNVWALRNRFTTCNCNSTRKKDFLSTYQSNYVELSLLETPNLWMNTSSTGLNSLNAIYLKVNT